MKSIATKKRSEKRLRKKNAERIKNMGLRRTLIETKN